MSQHSGFWYLACWREAKAYTSLGIRAIASHVNKVNIRITHVLSCINSCKVRRKLFELEADRLSVQTSSEGPAIYLEIVLKDMLATLNKSLFGVNKSLAKISEFMIVKDTKYFITKPQRLLVNTATIWQQPKKR